MRAVVLGLVVLGTLALAGPAAALGPDSFAVPSSARQLILVSSPTYRPPGYLASFRTFDRASATAPWKQRFATWRAEIGAGELVNVRHFGDYATPTGVFDIGLRMYGNEPNPGGLHYAYHQLVCGDWWNEDPYSSGYNQFVHVPCATTPSFASWSEALWTETRAYPYFAVLETNNDPTVSGANAPGAGIFLHHWMDAPTEGCVALPLADLLTVLRWLEPGAHPVIEIGTDAEIGAVAPAAGKAPRRVAGAPRRAAGAPRRAAGARRAVVVTHRTRVRIAADGGSPIAAGSLAALCAAAAVLAMVGLAAVRRGQRRAG